MHHQWRQLSTAHARRPSALTHSGMEELQPCIRTYNLSKLQTPPQASMTVPLESAQRRAHQARGMAWQKGAAA